MALYIESDRWRNVQHRSLTRRFVRYFGDALRPLFRRRACVQGDGGGMAMLR